MKKTILLAMILTAGLILKAHAQDAQPAEVPNKICPVSHEEVGEHGMDPFKVTYKGKAYNLCCQMCAKDFNKDPEKYTKMMEDEVAENTAKNM